MTEKSFYTSGYSTKFIIADFSHVNKLLKLYEQIYNFVICKQKNYCHKL